MGPSRLDNKHVRLGKIYTELGSGVYFTDTAGLGSGVISIHNAAGLGSGVMNNKSGFKMRLD